MVLFFSGCEMENRPLNQAMIFREELLSSANCSFSAEVTADYGDSINRFSMDCIGDSAGNLSFEVTQPESISGIRGMISAEGGHIEFEDHALYLPLLTDDLLTPASAPWIFLKTLRSGYITSACEEDARLRVTINDSYADDALMLDVWFEQEKPVRADILHEGKRILALNVDMFSFS